MKNQFMLKSLKFALVFILFVSSSCSDDTEMLNTSDQLNAKTSNEQILARGAKSSTSETEQQSAKVYDVNVDCNVDCIEVGSEEYFEKSDQQTVSWGGKNNDNNSKTIDIIYYNTETEFVLKVRSTSGWSDLVIDGVESWENGSVGDDVWGIYTFPLNEGWQACETIDFGLQVTGNGPQAIFDVSYSLIGVCTSCIESEATTAYVGDGNCVTVTGPNGNNAWWFYLDIDDGLSNVNEDIWGDKSNDIGDVSYDALTGMITITFDGNWFLETGNSESVKWYSYADGDLPENGRPTPGLAPNKGTSLSFDSNDDRYYAIHLDVATCQE